MKKTAFFLLAAFISLAASAQNHIAIQAQAQYFPKSDWTTNSVELNGQYIRDIGKLFHLGAGIGIGTAKPVKYWSQWKVDGVEFTEESLYLPVFLRAKIDFGAKPSHAFFGLKAGTRICSVEGFDGKPFNPFVANIAPAIGYDIKVGTHKLGIELMFDTILGRYQEINSSWDDLLKKYRYESFETRVDNLWGAVGLAVTFEF